MILPSALVRRFAEYEPLVAGAADRVESVLLNLCRSRGYAYTSRTKTIDSLAEKIETGRYERWSYLDDLFACTVIVPTLSEEPSVVAFCASTFDVIERRERGQTKKPPDVFRFDSTRLWARLRDPGGLRMVSSPSIYDVRFEIQVKSAFEHAWSVSTHALGYKSADVDWRRLRLVAQLKAAVEQLDTLIAGFEQAFPSVPGGWWPDLDEKQRIAVAVVGHLDAGRIPSEMRPKDLSRFCDNLHTLVRCSHGRVSIEQALDAVEAELSVTPVDLVPRSLSLLQYVFGVLVTRKVLAAPFHGFTLHITDELSMVFPSVSAMRPLFDYNG